MSKILYAAGTFNHIKSFHLEYINALRAEGHEVLTMAKGEEADFNIGFVKKMFSPGNIRCQRIIKKILKSEKFDAVILNTTLAAFNIRAVLPRKARPKVINIVHGYMFPFEPKSIKDRIFLFCEKLVKGKTDSVVVMNSEDFAITKKYKLCLGSIRMIMGMGASVHPVIEPAELLRESLSAEDKYVISFVGELYHGKNQEFLIKALPKIKEIIPNAVLWFIGDGVGGDELKALAKETGVSDSVFFLGGKPNPCDFIRASDLYVSPSKKEGLPFNILEALGCGKTVLASDVKGNRDLLEDGTSGFLFKLDDEKGFLEKVKMIHSGEIRIDPIDAINQYNNYSKEHVFNDTFSVMKELLEK